MFVPTERIKVFFEMEEKYREKDAEYFRGLLYSDDFVVRARAICVLAEIAGREYISDLAKVLLYDENPIVRHEAAYSLGQLGYREAIPYLVQSMKTDQNPIVRHESAIALGVIGREDPMPELLEALKDSSQEVVDSAIIALSNIEFCKKLFQTEKYEAAREFARKTGG
uniref:HEAT repeat domain-containing protein n=1 Tax=Caldiarchaeum subterraneum TaxID=311458 RepID=A0A7C5Y7B1_CALS0